MFLIIIKGQNIGRVYSLPEIGPSIIGRDKSCSIQLLDLMASRKHCQIEKRHANFFITDFDSRNKTFVNGKAIKELELKINDIIQLGNTTLVMADKKDMTINNVEEFNKIRMGQTIFIKPVANNKEKEDEK